MSRIIHLVMAHFDYNSTRAVRSFRSKPAADTFALKCTEYDRTAPECPPVEDTEANDLLWKKWEAKRKAWEKRHPAGTDNWSADSYHVTPIKLEEHVVDVAGANSHPCAICSKPVARGQLMCRPHWHMVPNAEQKAVYATFRAMTRAARKSGGIDSVHAYRQAREAAIKSVESQITTTTQEQQP